MKLQKKILLVSSIGFLLAISMFTSFISASSANVTKISDVLEGSAQDVFVSGNYLYVSTGTGGLKIYDISTVSDPIKIGEIDDIGFIKSTFVLGDYAYAAADIEGMKIINLTDPANPELVNTFRETPYDYTSEIIVIGDDAYLANDKGGFLVVNIADKTDPNGIGDYTPFPIDFESLDVVGNYVYLSGHYGMRILDVNNKYFPQLEDSYESSGYNHDIKVEGDFAYMTSSFEGLKILNVSDSSNIQLVGEYNATQKSMDAVDVVGEFAYVTSHNGFEVLNVTNSSDPVKIGGVDSSRGYDIQVEENYAFVAEFEQGVGIYDISIPTNPTEYARIDDEAVITDLHVIEDTAYVAVGEEGIIEIDLSDPSVPVQTVHWEDMSVDKFAVPGNIYAINDSHSVFLDQTYAEIGNYPEGANDIVYQDAKIYLFHNYGVEIVDVSTPASPSLFGSYSHIDLGGIQSGYVDGAYIYAVDPDYGVYILNANNPSSITIDGIIEEFLIGGVQVYDTIAYIVSPENGLIIYDITDITSPIKLGQYTSGSVLFNGLVIEDDVAYLGCGHGLLILDISNLAEPSLIYTIEDSPVYNVQLVGNGNVAYSTDGLEIVHIEVKINRSIPGYSTPLLIVTLVGISALLAFRKFKK